ncbi:MAG TPA: UPF0149 family protein [Burkholderiaceae bacterium]|nr:UPF0149 family protein [Burkholderiaceae bacterium]
MAHDLTDPEIDELEHLLAQTPEPLKPLGVVALDGYLCGVLVQPRLVSIDEWLPLVFDIEEARTLPGNVDATWHARIAELAERRLKALNEAIAEEGWFDPVLPVDEDIEPSEYDPVSQVPPSSRPLVGWVGGFAYAMTVFPVDAGQVSGSELRVELDRVLRHLPLEDEKHREMQQQLQRLELLATVDDAIADLVAAIANLWQLTSEQRYKVEQVRHEAPKVGRNDPCPCGSGRKYKHCHGAT